VRLPKKFDIPKNIGESKSILVAVMSSSIFPSSNPRKKYLISEGAKAKHKRELMTSIKKKKLNT
jgi:hypothetical protein